MPMISTSLPVNDSLLPTPYSFAVEQEMPLMNQSSLEVTEGEKSYYYDIDNFRLEGNLKVT